VLLEIGLTPGLEPCEAGLAGWLQHDELAAVPGAIGEDHAAVEANRVRLAGVPKLLRSYGLDSLDTAIGCDGFAMPDATRFVEAVSRATCTVYPAVGAGRDLRFEGGGIVGAALETKMGVVHAVAFPASDVARPTVRRGFGLQ
jgi:hypothetical protein